MPRSCQAANRLPPHFIRSQNLQIEVFRERLKVSALACGSLLVFVLGAFGRASQRFLNRGAGRQTAKSVLGTNEKVFIDFDGRALDHAYIVSLEMRTYDDAVPIDLHPRHRSPSPHGDSPK